MLIPNAKGDIEDLAPAKVGQESGAASEARELVKQVTRIRNTSDNPDVRILADAVLRIAAYVYAGR